MTHAALAGLTVRAYTPGDAVATAEVFRAAVTTTAATRYSPEQIAAWVGGVTDPGAWARDRSAAWTAVAESAGRVIGFADLTEDAVLDMLFVHPSAARRGVGRRLVETVLAEARRRGLHRVDTRASHVARTTFERTGFVVDREDDRNTVRGVVVPNVAMHVDL